MFRNPFKHLNKPGQVTSILLLLLAVANWLLHPYRNEIKDFFADWMTVFYVLFVIATLNKFAYIITSHFKGHKLDEMWMGKQPQSAWKNAYMETFENTPKSSIWVEKLLDFWLVSLIVSLVIVFIGAIVFLLFSNLIYHFFIFLIVLSIINYFQKRPIIKRK